MKLQLGDVLFRTTSPSKLLKYTVYGIFKTQEGESYQIECQNCNDHSKCQILIKEKNGVFQFSAMLNNNGEEESQHYWHNDSIYRTNRRQAMEDYYNKCIAYNDAEIIRLQKLINIHQQDTWKRLSARDNCEDE